MLPVWPRRVAIGCALRGRGGWGAGWARSQARGSSRDESSRHAVGEAAVAPSVDDDVGTHGGKRQVVFHGHAVDGVLELRQVGRVGAKG